MNYNHIGTILVKTALCCLFLLIAIKANSQETPNLYPEIRKPLPSFSLHDLFDPSEGLIDSKSLLGRPSLLIFWSYTCAPCMASFPKYNEIHKKYQDSLQVILIGIAEDEHTKKTYGRLQSKWNLELKAAFDSSVAKQFRVQILPTMIWVDKAGIVQSISTSAEFNEADVITFLKGDNAEVKDKSLESNQQKAIVEQRYDSDRLLFHHGNGGVVSPDDILFHSLLTEWNPSIPARRPGRIGHPNSLGKGKVEMMKVDMAQLYKFAYFGVIGSVIDTVHFYPIFEVSDSTLLYNDKSFCYSLKVPVEKSTKTYLMETMQSDLSRYFGLYGTIEKREFDCYYLIEKKKNALKVYSGNEKVHTHNLTPAYIDSKNVRLKDVLSRINYYRSEKTHIYNQTGIDGETKIEIKFDAVMYDIEDIKASLNEIGLDLVYGKINKDVLVVRDSK